MNSFKTLEYDKILDELAECALSEAAKERCLALSPFLSEYEVRTRLDETTQAKLIMESLGTPPLTPTAELHKAAALADIGSLLLPDQLEQILGFLTACRRMKSYLKKAEQTGTNVSYYGGSIHDMDELENEISRCIRSGRVDDRASDKLRGLRRKITITGEQIIAKLNTMLRKNGDWYSESFISKRAGRYTLPVKYRHKNDVLGAVIDVSQSGGTCFIEPAAVRKLHEDLALLHIDEDNEVRRILYFLSSLVGDYLQFIRLNLEAMETLDFLFAKAKLSITMKASSVGVTAERRLCIINARHPLLKPETAVPLDFKLGGETSGVIITGPNTGGKTVTLKTVGLLSIMAQSGLHVPADKNSIFCLNNLVLCDIGDGQSITENLSTFSSHMTNIIKILSEANHESIVLLDELGSGTDPAEGMGLAVAILDELCAAGCLFIATTHYPELKEYAEQKPGLINARMAFDKESLMPLYRLELGAAGESCALYIAERLGMPVRVLSRAHAVAYGNKNANSGAYEGGVAATNVNKTANNSEAIYDIASNSDNKANRVIHAEPNGDNNRNQYQSRIQEHASTTVKPASPRIIPHTEKSPVQPRSQRFNIGDSVMVYPQKEIGIVYARVNDKGEIGVQLKGRKKLVVHKRLKLQVAATELYPDNYDFSIVFDSVAERKARHLMDKKHVEGNVIFHEGTKGN